MRTRKSNVWKRLKLTVGSSLAAGAVFASACTAADIKHNLVAGTQSFIRSYAADLLEALIPSPEELIGGAEDE